MLTYREALEKGNRFMVESGIRAFCGEICKGRCCSREYGVPFEEKMCCSKISCHEKLPCVGYICIPLGVYLLNAVPEARQQRAVPDYWPILDPILNRLRGRKRHSECPNPYFDPYPLKKVLDLEFPDIFIVPEEIMEKLKAAVSVLMNSPESEATRRIVNSSWH